MVTRIVSVGDDFTLPPAVLVPLDARFSLKGEGVSAGATFVTLTGVGQVITIPDDSVVGLALTQGGAGSKTVAWPTGIRWDGGTAPTLSTAAGATDVVTLVADGSGGWLGKLDGRYAAPADLVNPSALTGLTAGTATDTAVPLSWTAATDNIGIAGYEYKVGAGAWTSTGSTGTSYTVTGLTSATAYTIQVRAFDAAGNKGTAASVSKTTTGPVLTYAQRVTAKSPLLYFPLDDTAGTTTPRQLGSATAVTGTATSVTFGATGIGDGATAASLTGTGYVNTSAGAGTLTAFTVEAIIKPTDLTVNPHAIATFANSISFIINTNGSLATTATGGTTSAAGLIVAGTKYHVATVLTATSTLIYVNGVEVISSANGWAGGALPALKIGTRNDLSYKFVGTMAGVAVTGRVLTASEILDNARGAGAAA